MIPKYRVGELDDRITIEREQYTDDGQGGSVKAWAAITDGTMWAHVRPLRGSEREHSERLQAEGGYMVAIRYRSDVTEADRIVWRGRAMNIRFVQDAGPRPLFLVMECDTGVAT